MFSIHIMNDFFYLFLLLRQFSRVYAAYPSFYQLS